MKVHNRFGGMRDFAIFCGDTRDASLKQGRETGISITSGVPVFMRSGCDNPKGKESLINQR